MEKLPAQKQQATAYNSQNKLFKIGAVLIIISTIYDMAIASASFNLPFGIWLFTILLDLVLVAAASLSIIIKRNNMLYVYIIFTLVLAITIIDSANSSAHIVFTTFGILGIFLIWLPVRKSNELKYKLGQSRKSFLATFGVIILVVFALVLIFYGIVNVYPVANIAAPNATISTNLISELVTRFQLQNLSGNATADMINTYQTTPTLVEDGLNLSNITRHLAGAASLYFSYYPSAINNVNFRPVGLEFLLKSNQSYAITLMDTFVQTLKITVSNDSNRAIITNMAIINGTTNGAKYNMFYGRYAPPYKGYLYTFVAIKNNTVVLLTMSYPSNTMGLNITELTNVITADIK